MEKFTRWRENWTIKFSRWRLWKYQQWTKKTCKTHSMK